VAKAVTDNDLAVAAVLSGNRNFEGRIHAQVKASYLASPPLVVAYALAGKMTVDITTEPLGTDPDGKKVFLKDIWPSEAEIQASMGAAVGSDLFLEKYADVFKGDDRWRALPTPEGERFAWTDDSTYIRKAPFFDDLTPEPAPLTDIMGARVLALLGDSVTTDHISPAGSIKKDSPDRPLTRMGSSRGRLEGNSLVIETDRIAAPAFNGVGVSQSEQMRVVERFTLSADQSRLDYEMTMTDPLSLNEPLTYRTYYLALNKPFNGDFDGANCD
jgi:hypothetical protein